MTEREKFGAWWNSDSGGHGKSGETRSSAAWQGWQAALANRDAEVESLRKDAERYHVVRRMNVQMFKDAYALNISTGKPFDEIVDNLRPFIDGFWAAKLGESKESKP